MGMGVRGGGRDGDGDGDGDGAFCLYRICMLSCMVLTTTIFISHFSFPISLFRSFPTFLFRFRPPSPLSLSHSHFFFLQ